MAKKTNASRNVIENDEVVEMSPEEVQAKLAGTYSDVFGVTGEEAAEVTKDDGYESLSFRTFACDIKEVQTLDKTLPLPLNTPLYLKYLGVSVTKAARGKNGELYTTQIKRRGSAKREALYLDEKGEVGAQLLHRFETKTGEVIGIWGNGTLNFQFIEDIDLQTGEVDFKVPVPVQVRLVYKGKEGEGTNARHDIEIAFPREVLSANRHINGLLAPRKIAGRLVGATAAPAALPAAGNAVDAEMAAN